ncbi:hypothetical protein [Synechococcus lacustris]|uniref:Calx-beta domain-containing protein n=1 Tax=Synechococcus lacustris str. Tous TaxID=1910958 RepID=A0A2P7EB41_9SYNE|nr:hypothetical protein [Synechococcus lacustris]PSI00430.1 hypothetical protein C7K08_13190 [Synechococcus lacustris str. Tous]
MAAVISVIATANGKETDGSPVVFSFSRTGELAQSLYVNYNLFGTAKAGSDYTGNKTGMIKFAAGSSIATLSLPVIADGALIDPYETIIARIDPTPPQFTGYQVVPYIINFSKQYATATITAEGMIVAPKVSDFSSGGERRNSNAFAVLTDYIYSTSSAFAALKSDGSVISWGGYSTGSTYSALTEPAGLSNVNQIFSNRHAFAALKFDGSVISWGDSSRGGRAPAGLTDVIHIFPTDDAFAALKSDGSLVFWGEYVPPNTELIDITKILTTTAYGYRAHAALKSDGTVISWGDYWDGLKSAEINTPNELKNITQIFSTKGAFAALRSDGNVIVWGNKDYGGKEVPNMTDVIKIESNFNSFAALTDDYRIFSWGRHIKTMRIDATDIVSTNMNFAALKRDGTVVTWGSSYDSSPVSVPEGLSGVSQIFSNDYSYAALTSDGSVISWGDSSGSGSSPAGLTGVVGFANPYTDDRLVIEPIPTYTLTPSAATINEGAVLTSTVATTNVDTGTKFYYALSGTGITTADFSAGALAGEGSTDATGEFTFTHTLAIDQLTEVSESLEINLYSDAARTLQVGATAEISIVDTSITSASFNLDVDGDGKVTALGDGLMVIRKFFGAAFAGDALTNKAMSPTSTRTTAEIHQFIESGISTGTLDVDKDGKTTALGDGLMVIRHLFGPAFAGAALTNKAINPDSPYFGPPANFAAVAANIDAMRPV